MWYNPSRTARIWDPLNNRHIEPNEKTDRRPDPRLISAGKIVLLDADSSPTSPDPVQLVAQLEVADDVADDTPDTRSKKRKGKLVAEAE